MTAEQFENAAFYVGQKAIFDGILPVEVIGFSNSLMKVTVKAKDVGAKHISCEFIELLHPDPRSILREIMRRMNSATGEPTACRLDPDLMEQVKKLFEDEK